MVDAGLIISGLRLLLDGYKLASEKLGGRHKDDPDPEKLEEVIADVEASARDGVPNPVDVEHEIDRKFNPEQSKKIKSDLAALALLADPPRLAEFDYWTALTQTAKSLQNLARKTELFALRGYSLESARCLYFEKTKQIFVPEDVIDRSLLVSSRAYGTRAYGKKVTDVRVALVDSDLEFPMKLVVIGHLKKATTMGERYEENVEDMFSIEAGGEKNRLLLIPATRYGNFTPVEYRLTADEIARIVEAMKSDVADYAAEIAKERDSARDLAKNVNEMTKNLSDKLG